MSLLIIAEIMIKPDEVSNLQNYMAEIAPDTRNFEGCKSVDFYMDKNNEKRMVLIEEWEEEGNYHNYHKWRVETGVIDKIRTMIDGRPRRMVLDKLDI